MNYAANKDRIKVPQIGKEGGEKWRALSEKEKEKYILLTQKDKERYEKQLTDLRKKGFFINDKGVKSTDMVYKKPKVHKPKKQ